jgi:membrane protease YdiL (CAAX protease family)
VEKNIEIIISAIFQVLLFSLIPFVWWLLTARKTVGFLSWVGLKKPKVENKKPFSIWISCLIFLFIGMTFLPVIVVDSSVTAASQFAGYGLILLPAGFAWGIMATGLGEEILFRGFLGKRCINKCGFIIGNIIQAIVFGLMHGVLFSLLTDVGLGIIFVITVITGALGWVMMLVNEKYASGSIVPSWLLHGIGNFAVSIFAMLDIL